MNQSIAFRADHVGSLLRPQMLKDAFRDVRAGRLDAAGYRDIQDAAIRAAIRMQEEVGLQSITDGEFRRSGWFTGLVEAVEGITTATAKFGFEDEAGHREHWQAAYVNARLRRTRPIAVDEFAFVQASTGGTPKVTMPTPSVLHFFRGDDAVDRTVYPDLDIFWSDIVAIYRAEIDALAAAGCRYLQLDEVPCAMLCDHSVRLGVTAYGMDTDALLDTYIGAINAALATRPPSMKVAIHLCRGNFRGRWMASGGYEPVAEKLFNELAVDRFFLEFDSERAGGFEPLRFMPRGKHVVLGLVSSKTPVLESIESIARRVDEASRFVPLDQLAISPQCGFASSVAGNPLTADEERAKLARVVEAARAVWG